MDFIASVCHNVNKAYCDSIGDSSQVSWEDAPDWQKESCINGVKYALANPDGTPEQQHESWLADKIQDGWVYGDMKDVDKKTHPCIVPYEELPLSQRIKDYLFKGVVDSFRVKGGN